MIETDLPPFYPAPALYLSISDIERLAKAGVKVEIATVVPQADAPAPTTDPRVSGLAGAIWDRYVRGKRARDGDTYHGFGFQLPFELLATKHGDKIWVSVHPTSAIHEPFQLQDDALVFPSDALMASLALWEREHK